MTRRTVSMVREYIRHWVSQIGRRDYRGRVPEQEVLRGTASLMRWAQRREAQGG